MTATSHKPFFQTPSTTGCLLDMKAPAMHEAQESAEWSVWGKGKHRKVYVALDCPALAGSLVLVRNEDTGREGWVVLTTRQATGLWNWAWTGLSRPIDWQPIGPPRPAVTDAELAAMREPPVKSKKRRKRATKEAS